MRSDPFVVVAPAEVDPVTAPGFGALLDQADPAEGLRVDCSEVTFMDSSGLGVLVRAHNRHEEAGGSVRVVYASAVMERLLDVSGLRELLIDELAE